MQPITSLDEFFTRSGAKLHLYHMGRRVCPCPRQALVALESGRSPWPEPWKEQARMAAVFQLGNMVEPAIWFLTLPLDEQGFLVPARRDAFVQRLLETLGRNAEGKAEGNTKGNTEATEGTEALMNDNPVAFTPDINFQAMLNARARHDLGLPPSHHHAIAVARLKQESDTDWQWLGLQGIADACVKQSLADAQMARALAAMPLPLLHQVCYCLEHLEAGPDTLDALMQLGNKARDDGDLETLCGCLRAVGSASSSRVSDWYAQYLSAADTSPPDVLAAIAGRGWQHLEDERCLSLLLERVAAEPDTDFPAVMRDLALIPRLRLPVMVMLRDAAVGSALSQRLGELTARARH